MRLPQQRITHHLQHRYHESSGEEQETAAIP